MSNPPTTEEIAERQRETKELTEAVIKALGSADLEVALTVLFNMTAHVITALAEGNPARVEGIHADISRKIIVAARAKLLSDDAKRRQQEKE